MATQNDPNLDFALALQSIAMQMSSFIDIIKKLQDRIDVMDS